jgi:hypothetical protein
MSTTDNNILSQLQRARLPKPKKETKPIAKVSEKKKAKDAEEKKAGVNADLDYWFEYHMEHSDPVCAECGSRADWLKLPEHTLIWKACQAHILPKKKGAFYSLRGNLDNHIILFPSFGGILCGHHGEYDSSWYNATTMKVWTIVETIFLEKLYPAMHPNERRLIPEQLQKLISI